MTAKVFFTVVAIVCAVLWAIGFFWLHLPPIVHILGIVSIIAFIFLMIGNPNDDNDDWPYTDVWP